MSTIQALNVKTSAHQGAFRITAWAGRETTSGIRADWVVYAPNVRSAVSRALKQFRRVTAPSQRFSDYTVTSEPLRADETILPAGTP